MMLMICTVWLIDIGSKKKIKKDPVDVINNVYDVYKE